MLDLLAIGGAHIDRTAQLKAPHIAGASNPANITETVGGGAFNALRNARLLSNGQMGMMSVRGGDGAGQAVEDAIDRAELVDLSGTFMDRHTPTYTAILDISGDLVTAIADMALYETGFDRQVKRLEGRTAIGAAKHVLIDANLTETAIQSVTSSAQGPVFGMCISPAKANRLRSVIAELHCLFLNRRELTSLTEDTEIDAQLSQLAKLGAKRALVTNGPGEILLLEHGDYKRLKAPMVEKLVDVTGAGDALTGATIAAIIGDHRKSLTECAHDGIATAQLTLQVQGPVCHAISKDDFLEMRQRVVAAQTD